MSLEPSLLRFVDWLDAYGETSYDHQSYFAGRIGGAAKGLYYRHRTLGTVAVAPMIFSEAFVPSARVLFWKPQRFPIADAHYASGFAFLSGTLGSETYYRRAVHFLDALIASRCAGYVHHCWGYPFDWVTMKGTIAAGTPLITTVPYVYEAFRQVYEIDRNPKWFEIMRSIAEHAYHDYSDTDTSSDASTCSYMPGPADSAGVVNASAYRAFLLTQASLDFANTDYRRVADRNLNFVLQAQNQNGAWFYSVDGKRDFVDHFHTCFVLKALAKIEALTSSAGCSPAIERGVDYYTKHLFDEPGLPRPFSSAPRLTLYKRELYDYAECINVAVLLANRFPRLDTIRRTVVDDLMSRWRKADGSFRSRELLVGWDNVPMHRWAQAQLFRSLCLLLRHDRNSESPSNEKA